MHVLIFLLLLPSVCLAKPTRFEVKDAAFRNLIQWTSDAPLEKIVAQSHFISGWFEVDPQNLKAGAKGDLEVDVRAFEMGPESRQAKLRETVLASQEHPGAFFKIDSLHDASVNAMVSGRVVTAVVGGSLTVRGIVRRQQIPIKATYFTQSEWTKKRLSGNLLKVAGNFDVVLNDLKFSIPEALSGLLAPVLKVSVDIVGTDQLPLATP